MSSHFGKGFIVYAQCAIFMICLAVPTLYFGHLDENSECQHGLRAGMILSDWVKVAGWTSVAVTIFIPTIACIAKMIRFFELVILIPLILTIDTFFWITWWIIGIIIVSTDENNHCVAEGKGMAVMAIVQIVIGKFRMLYWLCVPGFRFTVDK